MHILFLENLNGYNAYVMHTKGTMHTTLCQEICSNKARKLHLVLCIMKCPLENAKIREQKVLSYTNA